MIELLIARHGQSMGDVERRYEGRADLALSGLGREQAHKLAEWLTANRTPHEVISSPLQRASETATVIAQKLGLSVHYNDALMELDSGLIAGLPYEEADAKYPRPKEPLAPHERICVTGESLLECRFRGERFVSQLMHEYDQGDSPRRILLVSHGAMIDMLMQCFLKLPLSQDVLFHTGDTGIHAIKASKTKILIEFSNSTAHLQ